MQFPFFAPIITSMPSQRILLPQHQPPLSKVQPLFSVAAYFQRVVDTHSFVGIITQQLSNSATQQLSNSATQQLRRKVCLRPERRATFTFRQQHHYFSSIFADGKSGVLFFHVRQSLRFVLSGLSCALGMQRSRSCKVIINKAFYRQAWQAVWFDSG